MSKTKAKWVLKDLSQFDESSKNELRLLSSSILNITSSNAITASFAKSGNAGFGIYAFARTNNAGTILFGNGLTVVKSGVGVYDYTLTQPFSSSNYVVVGNPIFTTNDTNFQISNITTSSFRATLGQGDNGGTSDTPTDNDHSVTVFGVSGPTGNGSTYQSWLNVGNVGTEQDFINSLVGPTGSLFSGSFDGEFLIWNDSLKVWQLTSQLSLIHI